MQVEQMGAAIRAARDQRGLSQRALADRLRAFGLDWPPQTIQRVEVGDAKGYRSVTVTELLLIAAALNRSPDVLALPGKPHDTVELSEEYAVEVEAGRQWWAGRARPPMQQGGIPRWPFPDEATDRDLAEREHQEWQTSRPADEQAQRRFLADRPELAVVLRRADELRDVTRSTLRSRSEARAEHDVWQALLSLTEAIKHAVGSTDQQRWREGRAEAEQTREAIREVIADIDTRDQEDGS